MRLSQLAAALAAAITFAVPASAGGIVEYHLAAESPTLGRPIPYALYKPSDAPAAGERWPVVYLLHGHTGADGDWFTQGNIVPQLDRAIAEGRIPPMVVVSPGAGNSWYVDSPDPGGFGLVGTAFATDLIAAIDNSLPTAACREGRAIGGLSMGGYGAILQAIDHPELYVGAMSFSGAMHRPMQQNDHRLGWIADLYEGAFGNPFDAGRFNAANVFTRLDELRDVQQKPDFYLTIGKDDYADLVEASPAVDKLLRAAGANSTFQMASGKHDWDTWHAAIIPALEWLAPKLDPKCGKP